MLKPAWMRLLDRCWEPEGVASGSEEPKKPNGSGSRRDDDDEGDDDGDNPRQSWKEYALSLRKQSSRYRRERNELRDTATDLAIMQSMTRALPGLMRRQAKEHYGYKQEQATAAEDASFKSGADLIQKQGEALAGCARGPRTDIESPAACEWLKRQTKVAGR